MKLLMASAYCRVLILVAVLGVSAAHGYIRGRDHSDGLPLEEMLKPTAEADTETSDISGLFVLDDLPEVVDHLATDVTDIVRRMMQTGATGTYPPPPSIMPQPPPAKRTKLPPPPVPSPTPAKPPKRVKPPPPPMSSAPSPIPPKMMKPPSPPVPPPPFPKSPKRMKPPFPLMPSPTSLVPPKMMKPPSLQVPSPPLPKLPKRSKAPSPPPFSIVVVPFIRFSNMTAAGAVGPTGRVVYFGDQGFVATPGSPLNLVDPDQLPCTECGHCPRAWRPTHKDYTFQLYFKDAVQLDSIQIHHVFYPAVTEVVLLRYPAVNPNTLRPRPVLLGDPVFSGNTDSTRCLGILQINIPQNRSGTDLPVPLSQSAHLPRNLRDTLVGGLAVAVRADARPRVATRIDDVRFEGRVLYPVDASMYKRWEH